MSCVIGSIDHYRPSHCELDCILKQVEKHLLDPLLISEECVRDGLVKEHIKSNVLLVCGYLEDIFHLFQGLSDIHFLLYLSELAVLYLKDVQHVIHEGH